MRKPNSFSQIDSLHNNKFANQSQRSKEKMESSQRNLSLDSDSNSNKSTMMVPKMSQSDVADLLNEGNECSVIVEDNRSEKSNGEKLETSNSKAEIWRK